MNNRSEKNYLSVKETNTLVKTALEASLPLFLRVRGEISSFKTYPTASYFDIKDEESVLSCIIWNSNYKALSFLPKVGDLVDIEGSINVYVARGKYSFIARNIRQAGEGDALLKLERLKKKLFAEGLFSEERKREIPLFPKAIGIICARESAALSDLIKNLGRRWPLADIFFFPSLVQGEEAPASLLKALKISQFYPLDTLIVARGGGSNEDLSAFNDETLVRAIATSKMPVISAVGHEIDFTLVDYVSDLRVSTPTGAAEAATPNQDDILEAIGENEKRLLLAMQRIVSADEEKLKMLCSRPLFSKPEAIYDGIQEKLNSYKERLAQSLNSIFLLDQEKVKALKKHLSSLSPYSVLKRGYSIIKDERGKTIKSVGEVTPGSKLNINVKDGIIIAKVETTKYE